jgi:hypothetical protein
MRKLKVLFFAADPYSLPPSTSPRLLLDEDIRQIRQKIRLSEYRDAIEVDLRPAARLDDLLQALNEVAPDVVHFSGHGWDEGLIVMDREGLGPEDLDVALLTRLFQIFRGSIRLVLLNACKSSRQADAIAEVVGCAIGMRGEISDSAAIAFGAAFYRAVGFGHSVRIAYDQGCVAIGASAERDIPHLAARKDVDPGRIRLHVGPSRWKRRAMILAAAGAVGAALIATVVLRREPSIPVCSWDQDGMPRLGEPSRQVAASTAGDAAGSGSEIEIAKAQQRAGDDASALPHFRAAAESGNAEATGYLGVAYLCGEGTARRTDRGISWLREGAGKRDPRAMTALAFAYRHGVGVKRNAHWTRYWYGMAAANGLPEAMRGLGGLYEDEQKWDSAVAWYRRAIDAGSADAMADLGRIYQSGPAYLRNPDHARALSDSAARAGSARGGLATRNVGQNAIAPPPPAPVAGPDSAYRAPPLDDSGNLVRNGGFGDHYAEWPRSLDGATGKGTNEIVPFADARSGHALHLAYEGRGSVQLAQKISVPGPDLVFRGTFRASSHEGRMIGFSGTGIAIVRLEYLDEDGRLLGSTSFYGYVENPLASTPLVGVPRRGNGGNTVHYIDIDRDRLYKDYELDIRREIEENLLGVVPGQVRAVAITLVCGATDDGAGAELWVSDLSLRPKR